MPDFGITLKGLLIGVALFIVTFSISLAIVAFIMVRIPADYFKQDKSRKVLPNRHPVIRLMAIVGRNILGVILVVVGIVLSLPGVPGQGILTILLGVMLLDFPGKRRLEYKLVSRPNVRRAIDKLRHKFGKPKLVLD